MRNSKFFYKFLWLCCFVLLLVGCRKSVDSYIKEATKAMNEGDYAKAYEIVDIMYTIRPETRAANLFQNAEYDNSYYEAAFKLDEQIVKHEIGDIIAESSEDENASRILFIIEERFGSNQYRKEKILEKVIQLARVNNNNELATTLQSTKN